MQRKAITSLVVLGVVLNDLDVASGKYGYGGNYRYYQYYYSDSPT